MSGLVYQNNNNKCKGWVNPSSLSYAPQINSLSSYYSPSGSTTLVSINGANFYSYSKILFGTYNPTVYFINSNIIQFYVPNTLNSGTFPVQVVNATGSNSVNYTIDNASGYWLQNNNSISNTNTNSVSVTSLSRGAPITVTSNYDFGINNSNNWIICDGLSDITIKFPLDAPSGREIMFKNIGSGNVVSDSINILNLPNNSTNLIAGPGKWVTLVYDGSSSNWIVMQGN